ncbi:MAG: hypothetical protein KKB21_01320, partial [Nanoarchaeota archaeon]|nr:hypothetical protein [Nanoarchaeota archaeon]
EMFGVIEKNAEISARAVTAYDEETYGKKESGNNFLAYLIAGLTAVILVLGIAIYLAIKRKHE